MCSSPQSTRPPAIPSGWTEERGILRETFLVYLNSEDADAARQLAASWYLTILEADARLPPISEPLQVTELRAIGRDLRHLQGCLGCLDRDRLVNGLGELETRLSHFAGDAARDLARIAIQVERAVARSTA